jgi:lipid A 3-O-deacylase
MKKYILLLLAFLQIEIIDVKAQDQKSTNDESSITVRFYEDNDFLNDQGRGTDQAYTNGSRVDVFYTKNHKSKFFLDRWMPKAGDSSVNTFGYGVTHLMYTQSNILIDYNQLHDYNWAGAIVATHTLYSYNAQKAYDFQTEIVAGVMGPLAFAKPGQRTLHKIIGDPSAPQGWNNQFNDDALINVNFTAEKEIARVDQYLEFFGSAQVMAGTMQDGIDLSPTLLIGKMNPYFNGYDAQTTTRGDKHNNKVHAYFKFKPGVQFVAWNSLLEGGMFSQLPMVKNYDAPPADQNNTNDMYSRLARPQIENVVTYVSYGVVVVYKTFSLSYLQTHTSELVKDSYQHTYGNLTATYNW